jgi:hypothetical protein
VTVSDIRRRTAEAMGEDEGGARMTCRFCEGPATHSELSTFGARCRRCYDAYKREPQQPQKVWTGRKPDQGPLFAANTDGDHE